MQSSDELKKLIEITSLKVGLYEFAIEKDFYITKAIHALTSVKNDYFNLVFQGGTSLSKAYHLIERLSEDVDFRVRLTDKGKSLGKGARRNKLRDFRYSLVEALSEEGFVVPDKSIKVFYEGRFMGMQAEFTSAAPDTYLKPHIAIECFVGELALDPIENNITTIIQLVLGDKCGHQVKPVACVSLDETLAEKWVALTRRVANSQLKERISDKQLVRHLYDIHHLIASDQLTGTYPEIVKNIIEKDRNQFKSHNADYYKDPISVSLNAVKILQTKHWKDHWEQFLSGMVYERNKPKNLY